LSSNGADLDFDVNNLERLGANVDLDQTRIHRFVELSETRYQTNRACGKMRWCSSSEGNRHLTLVNLTERIGAWKAGYHTADANHGAHKLYERTVDTMNNFASAQVLSIGRLHDYMSDKSSKYIL